MLHKWGHASDYMNNVQLNKILLFMTDSFFARIMLPIKASLLHWGQIHFQLSFELCMQLQFHERYFQKKIKILQIEFGEIT